MVDNKNDSYELFEGSMGFGTYSNIETNIDASLFESLVSTEKIFGIKNLFYKSWWAWKWAWKWEAIRTR